MDVLTLNLWGTNGPVEQRMAQLVAALHDDRPDLLALQEVAGGRHTQAHVLAEELRYAHVHHIRSARMGLRGEGLAVVTDLDSTPLDPLYLPHGRDAHHRALQQVDVVTGDGTVIRIGNTHLAWRLDARNLRTAQTEAIRDALAGWSGPIVLLGDLNDVAGSPPLDTLGELGLEDAYASANPHDQATFDLANPHMGYPELAGRRIDHVLVRGLEVGDCRVVLRDPPVSDHYGVRATLTA